MPGAYGGRSEVSYGSLIETAARQEEEPEEKTIQAREQQGPEEPFGSLALGNEDARSADKSGLQNR